MRDASNNVDCVRVLVVDVGGVAACVDIAQSGVGQRRIIDGNDEALVREQYDLCVLLLNLTNLEFAVFYTRFDLCLSLTRRAFICGVTRWRRSLCAQSGRQVNAKNIYTRIRYCFFFVFVVARCIS